jgi:hypothetical protein
MRAGLVIVTEAQRSQASLDGFIARALRNDDTTQKKSRAISPALKIVSTLYFPRKFRFDLG